MKSNFKVLVVIFFAFLTIVSSCEQSDPQFEGRSGDTLQFSGRSWVIKSSNALQGPGPNFFSNHPNDVWVDDNGYLHLTISERDGMWKSTEVVSTDTMGYGTYIFTIEGDPVNIDENVVVGLFTWDDSTFEQQANSEVDIEFAKWGEADVDSTLQYGVQPIAFGPYNEERVNKPPVDNNQWIGVSTHSFTWTDSLITWASWPGPNFNEGQPTASWAFSDTMPARIKFEQGNGDGQSQPVVIPAPGRNTNARMNLWLLNGFGTNGPTSSTRQEIIIRKFQYIPAGN